MHYTHKLLLLLLLPDRYYVLRPVTVLDFPSISSLMSYWSFPLRSMLQNYFWKSSHVCSLHMAHPVFLVVFNTVRYWLNFEFQLYVLISFMIPLHIACCINVLMLETETNTLTEHHSQAVCTPSYSGGPDCSTLRHEMFQVFLHSLLISARTVP